MSLAAVLLMLCLVSYADSYWKPTPTTTWTWQISGQLDTSKNVAMYDIDLWDIPKTTITALKQSGKKVICYFR